MDLQLRLPARLCTHQETAVQSGTGELEKRVAATPASIAMLRKEGYNVVAALEEGGGDEL